MFQDKEYARTIWTPSKIAVLEEGWKKQKKDWYALLSPYISDNLDKVLDVGCGVGMYYDLLQPRCNHYIGMDPVKAMINRAKERRTKGDWRVGSIYSLPFPNTGFDLVFCWSVLVHLPHETIERALNELWRVTKKILLFNLYVSLDCRSFSIKGPWGEFLTAMDEFHTKKMLRGLRPKTHKVEPYERISTLDGKRFQRKIFILRKDEK